MLLQKRSSRLLRESLCCPRSDNHPSLKFDPPDVHVRLERVFSSRRRAGLGKQSPFPFRLQNRIDSVGVRGFRWVLYRLKLPLKSTWNKRHSIARRRSLDAVVHIFMRLFDKVQRLRHISRLLREREKSTRVQIWLRLVSVFATYMHGVRSSAPPSAQ